MKGRPLRERLVRDGLCRTPREAEAAILSGDVLIGGVPARTARLVGDGEDVRLKARPPYAGKGGLKLEGAIRAFGTDVKDKVCVDAGASTGGFTDCLLHFGAAKVYAVDVGFGQLTGALRQDPRVVNLERTNISDPALLSLSPAPTLATCDLSYLSLLDALPAFRAILRGEGEALALVKPLFEIADSDARRTGVIPDDAYAPLLTRLVDTLNAQPGTRVTGVCESPVRGNGGTVEFFLRVAFAAGGFSGPPPDLREAVERSVHQALQGESLGKGDPA